VDALPEGISTMNQDPIAVARQCYQAYADSDREAAEAVIAEDFHFTSPLDNRIDRKTYFARCWPNNEWITGYEFVRLIQGGEQVVATYIGQSNRGKPFRNTEVLTVRDGKIVEVEVYFGWSLPHKAAEGGFVNG
jgi:ketosteroid isomerase-like protein